MIKKHTPMHVKFDGRCSDIYIGDKLIANCSSGHAARIVSCVNSRDELVVALKSMIDLRDAVIQGENLPGRSELELVRAARATLGKATK